MNVLLRRLVGRDGLVQDPFGYVDDVAIGSSNYHLFANAMFEIDIFSYFSGLSDTKNFSKTNGLSSTGTDGFAKWIATSLWPKLVVKLKYTYLGFLNGESGVDRGVVQGGLRQVRRPPGALPTRSPPHAQPASYHSI